MSRLVTIFVVLSLIEAIVLGIGVGFDVAAIASGHLTAEQFDEWVDPMAMTRPE